MEMKRMIFGLLLPAALFLAAGTGCSAKVKEYRAEAVAEYLHDTGAYTQGLFFSGGRLYESTGQFGESSLRIVDLESGRVERQLDFNSKYFVEGSVILGDKLYVLTWTNRVAYVYDAATLEYVGAYSYPRDGWGLTTDGKSLIASDGSSRLYFSCALALVWADMRPGRKHSRRPATLWVRGIGNLYALPGVSVPRQVQRGQYCLPGISK